MLCISRLGTQFHGGERERKARRIKESRFRKSSPWRTQEGRRSMFVRRRSSTYNGGVFASSGVSEDQRAREKGG